MTHFLAAANIEQASVPVYKAEGWPTHKVCAEGHDGSHCKIKFLGCSRIDADGRSRDVALRREHAVPRIDGAGRHCNLFWIAGRGCRMLGSWWRTPNGGGNPETHIFL